ncbi:MAG: hypothetical protein EBQ69_09330 [Betaproteobacteria bacterium]|nr:hypothetical protein [Betaproteobacteria bacterium]
MSIHECLRHAPLFCTLAEPEIEAIVDLCILRHLPSGQTLLSQHDFAQSVYVLKKGAVRLLANNELISMVRTVQVFGEMSCILDNMTASATVITDGECEVIEISKADFRKLLQKVPRLWMPLFEQAAARLAKSNLRLSEVLEHSPEGFLKLDRQAKITDEFSTKCELYFGVQNLSGRSFPELVYAEDPKQIQSWLEVYALLFQDSVLSFEDICYLLTSNAQMGSADAPRDLLFSYHPSRDLEGHCVGIDVGVKDVTEQRRLEREQAVAKEKQAILSRVHANPESFFALQTYMVQTLQQLKVHMAGLEAWAAPSATHEPFKTVPATPVDLARQLHSLKGFSGMYALNALHDAVDQMEMALKHLQLATWPDCNRSFAQLEHASKQITDLTDSLDPALKKRLQGVVMSKQDFDELSKCLRHQDYFGAERILSNARSMEASQLFSSWSVTAQRMGNQIEKDVQFVLDGDDCSLPPNTFNELSQVLPQVLRNAIDHGIEFPGLREELGKPRVGTVKAQLSKMDQQLFITISDDGQGVDFSKLSQAAIDDQFIKPETVEMFTKTQELWRIMLIPGFSTAKLDAEEKTFSGMGVGMAAVDDIIQKLGGTLNVTSKRGEGTQVTIKVPLLASRTSILTDA